MNVLFSVFEADPFIKTGGLGDIGGTLPKALIKNGIDVRVMLPKLQSIPQKYKDKMKKITEFYFSLAWRNVYCGIEKLEYDGVIYYFIDNEHYFNRTKVYGYDDEGERMAYFSKATLEAINYLEDFLPDVINCNDWHTALVPVLLKEEYNDEPKYKNIKTVFTIHNIKFQGIYKPYMISDVLGLEYNNRAISRLMQEDKHINFMKAALYYCDKISTVSPNYAKELCTKEYGEGLDWLFREKKDKIVGILNGINQHRISPSKDKYIKCNYNTKSIEDKAYCKEELQRILGLTINSEVPVITIISRLAKQKGFELILDIFKELMGEDIQFVVVGVGEQNIEHDFYMYSMTYHDKFAFRNEFNLEISSMVYAGADMFLVPSEFEPCGLTRMMAMRYGTVTIVRETGGLIDALVSYNEYTDKGNGFSFTNFNAKEMLDTIKYAVNIYNTKPKAWRKIVINGMKMNFSWNKSAKKYIDLYTEVLDNADVL
ncbi:MAG: glycogen synthase GlgA [Peptostreptococcaceae bacterium]|nr:glycogen synthase GlgA [Peptostreptococcaceae bacterium]